MWRLVSTSWAATLFTLLSGCCVEYHAVGKMAPNAINRSVDRSSFVALVGTTLNSVGQVEIAKKSADGKLTIYTVHRGREVVNVGIDDEALAVYLGWDWRNHSLPGELRSALTRDFDAVFHEQLGFANLPCGWFGP